MTSGTVTTAKTALVKRTAGRYRPIPCDMTRSELVAALNVLPDLDVYITNGDLPDVPVAGVSVEAADYGQLVLISR